MNILVDPYARPARLAPALLALLPVFITVAVWFPALYNFGAGLVGLAVTCGLALWLADFARGRGRAIELRLFGRQGGNARTWLRHRSTHLSADSRRACHSWLAKRVPEWCPPTEEEENENPDRADDIYDRAVMWLIEYTRDTKKYALLFKENVTYGFRRNLLGLKWLGTSVAILATCGNGFLIRISASQEPTVLSVGYAALAVSALATLAWAGSVNQRRVIDAADGYARQLMAVCLGPENAKG